MVILIELTCPAEEGIKNASTRKQTRYGVLVQDIRTQRNPWTAILFTVEVGARGFVANSMMRCLRRLGFSNRQVNQLNKAFSEVSARCSYGIYLSRATKSWVRTRDLLVVPLGTFKSNSN